MKAIESVGGSDFTQIVTITDAVIALIEHQFPDSIPTIEIIQNAIEEILIKD
jgi:sulfur relay (sulfurtransferase) DsrF/TusC family protein